MEGASAFAVLGATGGIGSEVTRRLSHQGARVLLGARGPDRLAALGGELNAPFEVVDARASADVDRFVARAVGEFGRLDGVVHCVGSLFLKPLQAATDADWRDVLDTHLFSSFALLRAAMPHLRQSRGSAVLCSSVAGQAGLVNHEVIAAAKAGVEGLARSTAASYARWGVRVNVVAPGLVRTPLTRALLANDLAEQASIALHPLGRIGEPGDVASAIVWLLAVEQGWVTGQVIAVDGGLGSLRVRAR